MPFDPRLPFNDLPPLPPAGALETVAVLKACIASRVALAELKAVGALSSSVRKMRDLRRAL